MSPKAAKAAVIKKRKRRSGSGAGFISEVYIKELDAKQRLNGSCCAFIKVKDEIRFLTIADNAPEVVGSGKFFSIAVGASTSELGEAKDILSELGGSISDVYSPQDFYPTVALYFLSRYLKGVMEEFWSPRALAVEYMIYDPLFNVLHAVKLTGDYESYAVGEVDKTYIVVGAYHPQLRSELSKALQQCLDKEDVSDKTLQDIGAKLCKKYRLRMAGILQLKVVRAPSPGMQDSAVPPGEE